MIVGQLDGRKAQLESLRERGRKTDKCCYMVTTGQGGPHLDIHTMAKLTTLDLEIWWDVYVAKENET